MSESLREFEDLSIGGNRMPLTRSQRRQQAEAERLSSTLVRSIESSGTPPARHRGSYQNHPLEGRTGILYSVSELSTPSIEHAAEGLSRSAFVVGRPVRNFQDSRGGSYLTFQLYEPAAIRIHSSVDGYRVDCDCPDTEIVCKHVYFLFDGLNAVFGNNVMSQSLSQGMVLSQITGHYNDIEANLTSLPDRLNGIQAHDEQSLVSAPSYSNHEEQPRYHGLQNLQGAVEMLSIFEQSYQVRQYSQAFARNDFASEDHVDDLLVSGNLVATIFNMAVYDEVFYRRLRWLLSKDRCAIETFKIGRSRAQRAFDRLDRVAVNGPSGDSDPWTVPECARTLKSIVKRIRDEFESGHYYSNRTAVGQEATGRLVEILDEVCQRNLDIYATAPGGTIAGVSDRIQERNLYVSLIGDPPTEQDDPGLLENECFVVDDIASFTAEEWSPYADDLQRIYRMARNQGAPPYYLEKLQGLLSLPEESYNSYTGAAYLQEPYHPTSSSAGPSRAAQPRISSQRAPSVDDFRDRRRRRHR